MRTWRTRNRVTREPSSEKTLEARGVTVTFEGLTALEDVDLAVQPGEILGLIGPNGAGKTTLLNVISGFVEQTRGSIFVEGMDITDWSPDQRARGGLGRSFQGTRLFNTLTVLENIEAGVLCTGVARREARRQALELATRMKLTAREDAAAGALPAGERHLVGILRALASDPKFLLLDERQPGSTRPRATSSSRTSGRFETSSAVRSCSSITTCR